MIQRIQSIYLLISAIITVLFAFLTFASFEINENVYYMKVLGLYYQDTAEVLFEAPNMSLSAVVVFGILLALSAIFQYKNRTMQLRLVSLGIVAQLASIALVFFATSFIPEVLFEGTTPQINYTWVSFLPVCSVVFMVLAMRGIKKDEALLKSLDRIR